MVLGGLGVGKWLTADAEAQTGNNLSWPSTTCSIALVYCSNRSQKQHGSNKKFFKKYFNNIYFSR
jgi:hypothetical protein